MATKIAATNVNLKGAKNGEVTSVAIMLVPSGSRAVRGADNHS